MTRPSFSYGSRNFWFSYGTFYFYFSSSWEVIEDFWGLLPTDPGFYIA